MLKIKYSKHARHRMVERGISNREVKKAIDRGTKRLQDDKIISAYSYFEVVYKKMGETVFVITVKSRW
ncbi:MAG: DUF4258 domain-containing protein [Candidatus Hydrothermarchaeaceae archaeon]